MVQYVDNGFVCGWYFVKEGCYFGDGTKRTAERIEKEREQMTVRDLYIYSRDGHTFILYKESETKSCFKGSLEHCPTELIDKLVYQFRAIDFNTIEVILIG